MNASNLYPNLLLFNSSDSKQIETFPYVTSNVHTNIALIFLRKEYEYNNSYYFIIAEIIVENTTFLPLHLIIPIISIVYKYSCPMLNAYMYFPFI